MGNLHGLFYSVGAIAGITAAALCAVLVMWTLRDARRGASAGGDHCADGMPGSDGGLYLGHEFDGIGK